MSSSSQEASSLTSSYRKFIRNSRIWTSRVMVVALLALAFVTGSAWRSAVWPMALQGLGLGLVILAVFGRLWSTLYLSGHKTKHLITDGPYSMTRNPLYFFSLFGAMGVALGTGLAFMILPVLALFGLAYPTVIGEEERKLAKIHGDSFAQYCQRVPRFLPKLSLLVEPPTREFVPRLYLKAWGDVVWFFVAWAVMISLSWAHAAGALPVWWRVF